MTYTIDKDNLTDLFLEEVSRAAQMSCTDKGESLFDHVKVLAQDKAAASRFIEDGISDVRKRLFDVCTGGDGTLEFYLPDLDPSNEDAAAEQVTRWIVMFAVAGWLREKSQPRYEEYANRLQEASLRAVSILKTRMIPRRGDDYAD